MRRQRPNNCRQPLAVRRGVTLVEILVATALTLLLVAAMAQAFQVVGTTIARSRAVMEMGGQLRSVSVRLQRDLEGITVPVRPWPKHSSALGYFVYQERWAHDGWLFPGRGMSTGNLTSGVTHFGDADDVLMFTSRAHDASFVGLYVPGSAITALSSNLAEVVWWTTLTDRDSSGGNVPSSLEREDYVLYRRALLIRPDLNTQVDTTAGRRYFKVFPPPTPPATTSSTWYNKTNQADLQQLRRAVKTFITTNDLSVRFERHDNPANPGEVRIYVVANSLEDLTQPENRFAHSPIIRQVTGSANLEYVPQSFPFRIDRDDARDSVTRLPGLRSAFSPGAEPGMIKSGDQQGEDVASTRLLAFDVRAFDPLAFVGAHQGRDGQWGVASDDDDSNGTTDDISEAGWANSDDELVVPGDPGYAAYAPQAGFITTTAPVSGRGRDRAIMPVGRGTFVDLAYTLKLMKDPNGDYSYNTIDGLSGVPLPQPPFPGLLNSPNENAGPASVSDVYSHFSGLPELPATGVPRDVPTYDTWSVHYEHDGWDQDSDGATDEGTDGFDSDSANGVDDVGERETRPPYPVPLRGIQIRIRMIDHDTRQVHQVTVETDFTPE